MADISKLKPINSKVPVELNDFEGNPIGITVYITTPLDPSFIVRKAALANSAKAEKFKHAGGRIPGEVDLNFDLKAIAAIIVGWDNLTENGKEIKYSEKEAERLVIGYPLFAAQIKEAADNQSAFFTEARKNSGNTPKNSSKRTKSTKKASLSGNT